MKEFKIKPRKQEMEVWCGPACAQMVLSHYRIKMSQRKIANQLQMRKDGVDIAALGRFFLNKGFDVTLKFWVKGTPPKWFQTTDPSELRKILKKKLPGNSGWNWHRFRLLKFLDAGGKLNLESVWVKDIQSEIDDKRPAILFINPRILGRYGQSDTGHFVVPIYMTRQGSISSSNGMIMFNDPWTGKEECGYLERVMLSCHLWFGAGLFIKRKS